MLIRRVSLLSGAVVDIRVHTRVEEIAPELPTAGDEVVVYANGGLVLPGLHDHHVHVRSAAAALGSVRVGPPQIHGRSGLASALAGAQPDADGWIRAVGYHDAVAGPLTRDVLDELAPAAPLRVQDRSGAMWVLNSAALSAVGLPRHPDGRLLRTEVSPAVPQRPPALRPLSDALLAHGVTGVTDATPGQDAESVDRLADARRHGAFVPRLHCLAPPGVDSPEHITLGPTKRILDDSTLDLEGLVDWIGHCHRAGRAVAVHCVTAMQLVVTIAALRAAGVRDGDRIEHAAMVPPDCVADLADLGVTVVTQPNFIAERGDQYLASIRPDELDQLWRVRTLRDAGVPVALSTDTPFGELNPWAAMRAAVDRKAPSGAVVGVDERVSPLDALLMFLGRPDAPMSTRRVAVGEPGDLCWFTAPADVVLARLDASLVAGTIIDGTPHLRTPA